MIERHFRIIATVCGQVEQRFMLAPNPNAAMNDLSALVSPNELVFGELPLLLVTIKEVTFGSSDLIYTDVAWALDNDWKRADMEVSMKALRACQRGEQAVVRVPELEMHRMDYATVQAAGFDNPSELLAAYKRLYSRLEAMKEPSDISERAVGDFTKGVHEVSAGFDDLAFEGQPEPWSEKLFARISYYYDRGDPSVGLPGRSGWTLDENQSGTVLEDLARPAYYVLHVEGDVDPYLHGPFASTGERNAKAGDLRVDNSEDGLYWVDVINGVPTIGFWTGGEMDALEAHALAKRAIACGSLILRA